MQLRNLDAGELRAHLGIELEGASPSARGVAKLIRSALRRWGVAPKRDVRAYVQAQCEALGCELSGDLFTGVLDRLVALGDVAPVTMRGEGALARTPPRWIRLSPTLGVFLGCAEPVLPVTAPMGLPFSELSRRFDHTSSANVAALLTLGATEVSLVDWLGMPDYERAARRRAPPGARATGLHDLWAALTWQLDRDGAVVSDTNSVLTISGQTGGHFGATPTAGVGRWTTPTRDGTWCGKRRGYAEQHWRPVLVHVSGEAVRALDLHDDDELDWAVIARGEVEAEPERAHFVEETESLEFTFPPPAQVQRLMHLLGEQRASWTWKVDPAAQHLWRFWANARV